VSITSTSTACVHRPKALLNTRSSCTCCLRSVWRRRRFEVPIHLSAKSSCVLRGSNGGTCTSCTNLYERFVYLHHLSHHRYTACRSRGRQSGAPGGRPPLRRRDVSEPGGCSTSLACQAETQTTQTTVAPVLNPWQRCGELPAASCTTAIQMHRTVQVLRCKPCAHRTYTQACVLAAYSCCNMCRYCIALDKHPFITKACTSLTGFMLGDVLAQRLEGAAGLDFGRVLHLGAYGFFLDGPVGHTWYKCAFAAVSTAATAMMRTSCGTGATLVTMSVVQCQPAGCGGVLVLADTCAGAHQFPSAPRCKGRRTLCPDGVSSHKQHSYRWLDGTVDKNLENSKGTAAVAIKTSADQLIWAPVMTCGFLPNSNLTAAASEPYAPSRDAVV
jgi:hypothetical protein